MWDWDTMLSTQGPPALCRPDQPQQEQMWQSRSRFPNCRWWVLFTCQSVTLSLAFCSFTECSNLSTRTWGFWVLAHGAGEPRGVDPCGNGGPGGQDSSVKISDYSIHFYPLKKPNFQPLQHAPSPGGFLLSILALKWAAVTLTLCTQHCVQVSHLRVTHQNSTSIRFSITHEVPSCPTQLPTARTVIAWKCR